MGKLTDNEFSKSFLSRMQNRQVQVNHMDISKQEIQRCWQRQIPYLYKDNQRIRKTTVLFVLMPMVVKMSLNWRIWNVPCIVKT